MGNRTRSVNRRVVGGIALAVATVVAGGGASGRAAVGHAASAPVPGTILTVAGGIGGPALATQVALGAIGVTFASRQLYISGGPVRRVDSRTDWLTNPVGNGELGFTPDGGLAAGDPVSSEVVTADHAGNLIVFDSGRIRVVAASSGRFYGRVMLAGRIYTVAGTGAFGSSGDGGPALKARFMNVQDIGVDGSGNVLVADIGAGRVRLIAERSGRFYGQMMTRGAIYTIAGGGRRGMDDGGPGTKAKLFPYGIAVDGSGNVLIADDGASQVRVVAVRSGTFYGRRMTGGDIYTIAGNGQPGFSGDGGPAARAGLNNPLGLAVDRMGNVLIADSGDARVRVVAARSGMFYGRRMTRGDIYTIAGDGKPFFSGDGGPATRAGLGPFSVTIDGSGNVVVPDGERVRVVAERAGTFYGHVMRRGDIYTVAGNGLSYSGDGRLALTAQIDGAYAMAVDGHGTIIETELNINRVRVVAGTTGTFYGVTMRAGHIYTVAGDGAAGFAGDGGPAVKARVDGPWGVTVDGAGNLVFADSGNYRIRVVAAGAGTFYGQAMTAGHIYTVAGTGRAGFSGDGGPATRARLSTFYSAGVSADGSGNILVVDGGNGRIRMIAEKSGVYFDQHMTAGNIYTIAGGGSSYPGDGGPATGANINIALGAAVDGSGNLLIAAGTRVRVVAAQSGTFYGQKMVTGHIYTIAGSQGGDSGDGGPATKARLGQPRSLAVDQSGNVIVADSSSAAKVRVIAAVSGVFYGIPMTVGDIYTVAGDGTEGDSGDGGPATHAEVSPISVTLDQAGSLLIGGWGAIREVAK